MPKSEGFKDFSVQNHKSVNAKNAKSAKSVESAINFFK
jgi:hypothetical protein